MARMLRLLLPTEKSLFSADLLLPLPPAHSRVPSVPAHARGARETQNRMRLAVKLGLPKMVLHIVHTEVRTEWAWGPVAQVYMPRP